jgi:ribosomal protein S18 acetylase RimI-like enzyme
MGLIPQSTGALYVRPMIDSDVLPTALLHIRVFPDYFLGHMGERFLRRFYRQFIERPGYGSVAVWNGDLVGFVVGTTSSTELYSRLYQREFFPLALLVLQRILVDAYIRRTILARAKRIQQIQHALRSLLPRRFRGRSSSLKTGSQSRARLLQIGVDLEFRGQGVADELVRHFCAQLARDGIDIVGLSVRPDNARAIRFYEKIGCQLERETETTMFFLRSTKT